MDEAERRDVIARLNNLAHYVAKGYPLEWHEPQPRGRKGRSHEALRTITFTVFNVERFDDIGWGADEARASQTRARRWLTRPLGSTSGSACYERWRS